MPHPLDAPAPAGPPPFWVGVAAPAALDPPGFEAAVARALAALLARRARTHRVSLVTGSGRRAIDRAALAAAERFGWAHHFHPHDRDPRHWLQLAATCDAVAFFGPAAPPELRAACRWAGVPIRCVRVG